MVWSTCALSLSRTGLGGIATTLIITAMVIVTTAVSIVTIVAGERETPTDRPTARPPDKMTSLSPIAAVLVCLAPAALLAAAQAPASAYSSRADPNVDDPIVSIVEGRTRLEFPDFARIPRFETDTEREYLSNRTRGEAVARGGGGLHPCPRAQACPLARPPCSSSLLVLLAPPPCSSLLLLAPPSSLLLLAPPSSLLLLPPPSSLLVLLPPPSSFLLPPPSSLPTQLVQPRRPPPTPPTASSSRALAAARACSTPFAATTGTKRASSASLAGQRSLAAPPPAALLVMTHLHRHEDRCSLRESLSPMREFCWRTRDRTVG